MSKKDLKEIHELLLQNVREQNEKESKEISKSLFNMNSKKNLISIAKETLKPKNIKHYKIGSESSLNKAYKLNDKKKYQISPKNDNIQKNIIYSDKQYLCFMLNELKLISSSIKKKQKLYNPSYSNNNTFLRDIEKSNKLRKYNSYEATKNNLVNLNMNKNIFNNIKLKNCNMVNLLDQVIGETNDNYKSENNITENSNYFNNLYYDKEEKKLVVREDNYEN